MTDEQFYKQIVDGSQMVSVLLVFLSIIFGLKYPLIADLMHSDAPDASRVVEREAYRRRLVGAIWHHVMPICIPSLLLALALGPSVVHIWSSGGLTYPTLQIVPLLFILSELSVCAAFTWCAYATIKLLRKARKA